MFRDCILGFLARRFLQASGSIPPPNTLGEKNNADLHQDVGYAMKLQGKAFALKEKMALGPPT